MPKVKLAMATAAALSITGIAFAVPALGAPPGPTAELVCPSATYTIVGFSRGQPFHVVGSTSMFIVTSAVLNGEVVLESPAQADRPLVTCTTVSPIGNAYTFTGFFTPAK
jgi:hypothetical protein